MSDQDFNDGMGCGFMLGALVFIMITSFFWAIAYLELKDSAISAGVAHYVIDSKTGVSQFEFIKTVEIQP